MAFCADDLAHRETFSPFRALRTPMRARVVWLEVSLLLAALTFVELGEVLRELRTDIVLDWFISLAPLIWIGATTAKNAAANGMSRCWFSASRWRPPSAMNKNPRRTASRTSG